MDNRKICEWNEHYAVNVPVLDRHHQKLFDLLNDLYVLMGQGSEDKPIIHIIDELLDYTDYHFREEERVMVEVKYPELITHQRMHQEFVRTVSEFHSNSHNGMAIFVATRVSNAGLAWLKNHILGVDHKYYEFMEGHGMKIDH